MEEGTSKEDPVGLRQEWYRKALASHNSVHSIRTNWEEKWRGNCL